VNVTTTQATLGIGTNRVPPRLFFRRLGSYQIAYAGEVVNFRSIETEVCRLLATIARSCTLESPRDLAADFDEDRAPATALLRADLVLSQQYG
jgi:hypothetical protein